MNRAEPRTQARRSTRAAASRPRVLLVWPGGLFSNAGSAGVPQLLHLAQAIALRVDAHVDVIDLDMERALGPVDLGPLLAGGYDVVGLSCYSSYDFLKVMALAGAVRQQLPEATIVAGGYHVSARPADLLTAGSPVDYAVVGDGEGPFARLVEAVTAGRRPLQRVLGPEAFRDPNSLMPYDWSLLSRYRSVIRTHTDQLELYLARGCPYDCSFCMERAKRETAWRPIDAEGAVEELHRADAYFDLRGKSLRIPDPLFGMRSAWRKTFLEGLARRPIRAEKVWLVMRADLIDRTDMELMARANVAVGFGLESGDPGQLRRIRKTGKLAGFLDKMLRIGEWARALNVPFGANIIVGHPGETETSMRVSARYMEKLFLGPHGTHGFLAVDPFRLYPGSPIDEDLDGWREQTGMRAHHYPWWYDGDQAFLSEWIDPSDSLSYERAEQLRYELFGPIVAEIPKRFAYTGQGREYMMRAPRREAASMGADRRARMRALHALWRDVHQQLGQAAIATTRAHRPS